MDIFRQNVIQHSTKIKSKTTDMETEKRLQQQKQQQEKQFKQDLNDFEAMLSTDLDRRVSETTKKFSFDFFAEAPVKGAESPFKWEETQGPPKVRKEPICRLALKPKISVDAIVNAKSDQNMRFSLVGRDSIFSSSAATESTACMSNSKISDIGSRIDSGVSILSGSIAAFNDANDSLNQSGFDTRMSILLGKKLPRRGTVEVYGGAILEDARESCLDNSNPRVSELEGTINSTNDQVTNIKSASKSGSVSSYVNASSPRENQTGQKSNRSNGSGHKRDLMMRKDHEESATADANPFSSVNEKVISPEETKEEDDEDKIDLEVDEATPVIAEWQEQNQITVHSVRSKETKPTSFVTNPDK